MRKRVEKSHQEPEKTDSQLFAGRNGIMWRSPLLSMDAKALLQYVITRQRPKKYETAPDSFCWASLDELEVHFRIYSKSKGGYVGYGSRGRVIDAIAELEAVVPRLFRVERIGGSGRNRYFALPYHKWPQDEVDRFQQEYDDLMEWLGSPAKNRPRYRPKTTNGPKIIKSLRRTRPAAVLGTTDMGKEKEAGEHSGDRSGDSPTGESVSQYAPDMEPLPF